MNLNLNTDELIVLLVVAAVVGILGRRLMGYSRRGLLTSIALGFIGALAGIWAVKQFRLPEIYDLQVGHTNFPVVWAIIGSGLVVALLGVLMRRRYL